MIRTSSILAAFALITLSCRTPKIMINKETYQNLNDGLYAYIQTDKGNMLALLYDQKAPMTVANFVGLAEGKIPNKAFPEGKPFYDGLTFHRIIKDFMIQGGDPQGDGRGGPGYQFPTEIHESLTHNKKGILSMANSGPDTNGSQFFITHNETPWLDGKYNVFGEVIQGSEVIDSIAEVKTGGADRPLESIAIQKITIVRKGDAYKNYDGAEAFQSKMNDLKKVDQAIIQRQQEMTAKAQEISDGLKYVILKEGTGAPVRSGDLVEVHYTLWLDNGKKIDSSHDRAEPLSITAGVGQVIKGWDRILQELKKGSEAYAIIPPQWGYGSRGAGNVIPPDATLYFEIKVLE